METPRWDECLNRFVTTVDQEVYVLEPMARFLSNRRLVAAAGRARSLVEELRTDCSEDVAFAEMVARQLPDLD